MKKTKFAAEALIDINASPAKVWDALINPALVKEYLFGTEMTADLKIGGKITYKGVWEGKSYEDKGTILQLVPEKILETTYWSSMSGTEDKPENYANVTYSISKRSDTVTELMITQDNCASQEAADHSSKNWAMILDILKKILEK
jgi:uncharacterized protein YndB with AHSA1/START domain